MCSRKQAVSNLLRARCLTFCKGSVCLRKHEEKNNGSDLGYRVWLKWRRLQCLTEVVQAAVSDRRCRVQCVMPVMQATMFDWSVVGLPCLTELVQATVSDWIGAGLPCLTELIQVTVSDWIGVGCSVWRKWCRLQCLTGGAGYSVWWQWCRLPCLTEA